MGRLDFNVDKYAYQPKEKTLNRYRGNPYKPPDVLGVGTGQFEHTTDKAETFTPKVKEKEKLLKTEDHLQMEGKLDDTTIHKGSFRNDTTTVYTRSTLMIGARDANLLPDGGISDGPTEYDQEYKVHSAGSARQLPDWYKWDNVRTPFGSEGKVEGQEEKKSPRPNRAGARTH